MKKSLLLTAVLVLLGTALWAIDDTPENRDQQADQYLKAVPVKEMLEDMVKKAGKFMPEPQRQKMQETMKYIDFAALDKAAKDVMVKNFTADELKALADFCSTPVGRSAMKKLDASKIDVMQAIQKEMMKAMAKANSAGAEKKGEEKKEE
jgi:hypothetical protein